MLVRFLAKKVSLNNRTNNKLSKTLRESSVEIGFLYKDQMRLQEDRLNNDSTTISRFVLKKVIYCRGCAASRMFNQFTMYYTETV